MEMHGQPFCVFCESQRTPQYYRLVDRGEIDWRHTALTVFGWVGLLALLAAAVYGLVFW
jgi:hypothetical protein